MFTRFCANKEKIMTLIIMGDSCTGKSTIAEALRAETGAEVFSGKDYLKLAKGESAAKLLFKRKLAQENVIYVVTEREDLALAPENAFRVRVTASLETIQRRFAERMHGNLPEPVKQMLARKHGAFDTERCDLCFNADETASADTAKQILSAIQG